MELTRKGRTIDQRIAGPDLAFIGSPRFGELKRDIRIMQPPHFFAAFRNKARAVTTIAIKRGLALVVLAAMVLAASQARALAVQVGQDTPQAQDAPPAVQSAPLTPEAVQQLVAPIALYPDALVAQILAASTYPSEIVEADRWLRDHSKVEGEKLAKDVDKQSWDPSVKALTPFSSVLSNLDTNLSWTSALGDAYYNQEQDVLDAVQAMRARAKDAGNLQSTSQETVTNQGPTIIIQPADPDVCYLPEYNPWLVYGAPVGIYPGYIYDSFIGGPYISFGLGIGIGGGFWGGFGWGWHSWGFDWRRHDVIFNHNTYVSNSRVFSHRFPGGGGGNFGRGDGRSSFQNHGAGDLGRNRGGAMPDRNSDRSRVGTVPNQGGMQDRPGSTQNRPGNMQNGSGSMQNRQDLRGFGQPGSNTGTRSGAFSGFGQGGIERGSASRGQGSFGGGGLGGGHGFGGGRGFGGGGGMHGGGGFGGGRGFGGGGGHGGGRH